MKRASRPFAAYAVLGLIGLSSLACSSGDGTGVGPGGGSVGGSSQTGGSPPGTAGSGTIPGGGNNPGGGTDGGGSGPGPVGQGGPKLRVLTETEYRNSLNFLLGPVKATLTLPPDTSVAGFISIGAAEVTINASAVPLYETASRAAAAEVFADSARWQKLVGCQPAVDLNDACVTTFLQTFGKRVFRRDLVEAEKTQWLNVAKETAQLSGSAAKGLEAMTSGLLQSPNFLYRVEINKLEPASSRLKYDGTSMALRLSFLLTGHPPDDGLLTAAAAGQLDTVEGLRAAATPLMNDANAVNRMAEFFDEYSQAQLVNVVEKSAVMFPTFNDSTRKSMLEATRLFIKNVVLAPGADVRSFFNSDQTFVDATLAPIYGVSAPASGFMQMKLAADTGRAGILGQAGVLAGHSLNDHNSPTRRGVFVATNFLCRKTNPPPDGVITELPNDPGLSTRERMELHRTSPQCAVCHTIFDPPGLALEHFDSIGKYRATEDGLAIDATGEIDGVKFDGAAQLGETLSKSPRVQSCMMGNFYRAANGVMESEPDATQIAALSETLTAKGYVWRDFLNEFIVSDAFRSAPAPALPVTSGNQ